MINEDLTFGVCSIASIHYETRQMPKTVDPVWVTVKVGLRCLELDQSRRLVMLTIKDNFTDRLVVFIVVDQSAEEFIDHSSPQAMGISFHSTIFEKLNASLDQIRTSLPFKISGHAVEKFDFAVRVVDELFALRGNRVDLHRYVFVHPIGSRRNSELLLSSFCNKRFGNRYIAYVQA